MSFEDKPESFLKVIFHKLAGVNEEQAIEMLSQHLITRPVFEALFEDYDFAKNNPVSRALQRVINAVESTTDDVDKSSLEKFYNSVKLRAEGVENADGKQKIIIELTGDMDVFDGEYGVHIIDFKLWPESEWLNSPGGLGIRYMPGSEHLAQNEPKMDFRGAYKSTFTRILDKYRAESVTEREKGNKFELLMKRYLQTDPIYASSLTNVWLWNEFFAKDQFGGKDVASTRA